MVEEAWGVELLQLIKVEPREQSMFLLTSVKPQFC